MPATRAPPSAALGNRAIKIAGGRAQIGPVPVNLAGLPAISIPAGHDTAGYPLGLQIIGKAFQEQEILNLAYAIEDKINFKNKINDWWIK